MPGLQPPNATSGLPPSAAAFGSVLNAPQAPTSAPQGPQTAPPLPPGSNQMTSGVPGSTTLGGVLTVQNAAKVLADIQQQSTNNAQAEQYQPVIQGLAGHVKNFFTLAQQARFVVEQKMLEALYSRRGEYMPAKAMEIEQQGQTPIYMMLFSVKCRQAESLLRDAMIGAGDEKPWTIKPTPKPDLPQNVVSQIMEQVTQEVQQAQALGQMASIIQIMQRLRDAKEEAENYIQQEARAKAELMETKMEDQLVEGGYLLALDQFLSDLTTFKAAVVKGPVVRNRANLAWQPDNTLDVVNELRPEWERVDPFNLYPAPWARDLQTAPFIERHRLTRTDLNALIGVPGYSEDSIRQVLSLYDTGLLKFITTIDSQKAMAEGRNTLTSMVNNDLIDALQYWGSVPGSLLIDWGLKPTEVPDPTKEYEVECWLVGDYVIRAVLNPDPLGRRPYYHTSYERIPGTFWGNSMFDLMKDCQDMCNSAARALASNMAVSSGPQVWVNTDRLPNGEEVTNMYPWKVWQGTSDPMGSTAAPITFFQPNSNAEALMQVYSQFSSLADDYTGIPRYMTGTEGTPGAGRTASGLSMMIGNASKIIKQVIAGIDQYIIEPMITRLYQHNMQYGDDADMKGDVNIVALGAMSLVTKDAAQVRRNEFLQVVLTSPLAQQIVGVDGAAQLLRETVKTLDMDTDQIVPPLSVIKQRQAAAQAQAVMMAAAQAQHGMAPQGGPSGAPPGHAQPPKPQVPTPPQPHGAPSPSGQALMNQAPVTDHFSPAST